MAFFPLAARREGGGFSGLSRRDLAPAEDGPQAETGAAVARLRPERLDDEGFRLRLFRAVRGALFAGLDPPVAELLSRQMMAGQVLTYAARYPQAASFIIECDGAPCGRILIDRAASAITLVDISLLPERQGRGIGARLLAELQQEAAGTCAKLRLNVAADNPARRLYERLGFTVASQNETDVAMVWTPRQDRIDGELGDGKPT